MRKVMQKWGLIRAGAKGTYLCDNIHDRYAQAMWEVKLLRRLLSREKFKAVRVRVTIETIDPEPKQVQP